jgi:hypothetical protein
MLRKITVLTAVLAALTVVVTSCDSDNPQENRSVVYITSLNDNTSPLESDIITNGTVFPDAVPVVFRNRPYNTMVITHPDLPYGSFQFTRYTVEWTMADGSQGLPTYQAGLGLTVDTEEEMDALITVVTQENKANPPLSAIAPGELINMNARITFYGHEVGTDRETSVVADLGVLFADFADPTTP